METETDVSPGAIAVICIGARKNGTKCDEDARPGSSYCYNHDPALAEERHLNGVRGNAVAGRGRPARRVKYQQIEAKLASIAGRVEAGELSTKIGGTLGYLYMIMLQLYKQEAEEEEKEELYAKLAAIEEQLEDRPRWVT